jgi:Family of unknown function (DUF5908)
VPVTIRELVTEVVLAEEAPASEGQAPAPAGEDEMVERVVRRALERVIERLRMEWER